MRDVEVGIDRVYGALKRNELLIFSDLAGFLGEMQSYSRALDDMGEPTEDIEDKATYHFLDACRYVIGWIKGGSGPFELATSGGGLIDDVPAGVFAADW